MSIKPVNLQAHHTEHRSTTPQSLWFKALKVTGVALLIITGFSLFALAFKPQTNYANSAFQPITGLQVSSAAFRSPGDDFDYCFNSPAFGRIPNINGSDLCPVSMACALRPKERKLARVFPEALQLNQQSRKPKALFFVAQDDFNGAMEPTYDLNTIGKLLEEYDLKYIEIESTKELCEEIYAASQAGIIQAIIIHAHGQPTGIHLSAASELTYFGTDIARCLAPLDKSARILLFSCSTASDLAYDNIARFIAEKGGRFVIAPSEDISAADFFVIHPRPLSVTMMVRNQKVCREFPLARADVNKGCINPEEVLDILDIVALNGVDKMDVHSLSDYYMLAIQHNHLKCLQTIIDSKLFSKIPATDLANGFNEAIINKHPESLQAIINSGRFHEISKHDFSKGFDLAVREGHSECLQAIIDSNRFGELSADELGWAFGMAAIGRPKCLQVIIDSGRFHEISKYDFRRGLEQAVDYGDSECLQMIIDSNRFGEISVLDLATFLGRAARKGYSECLQAIIDSNRFGEISAAGLGWAFVGAAENGYPECLQAIIDSNRFGEISNTVLTRALNVAKKNCYKIIKKHLPHQSCIFL